MGLVVGYQTFRKKMLKTFYIHSLVHSEIRITWQWKISALAQNEETVRGCIAGNVTLKFKPTIFKQDYVSAFYWIKERWPHHDTSFAKFVANQVALKQFLKMNTMSTVEYSTISMIQKTIPYLIIWEKVMNTSIS